MVPDDGNDLIFITVSIANFDVKRILIDVGSVVEVLSLDAFPAIELMKMDLKLAKPIYGFANQPIRVLTQVTLLVTLGQGDHKLTLLTCFLVVNQSVQYQIRSTVDEVGSYDNYSVLFYCEIPNSDGDSVCLS